MLGVPRDAGQTTIKAAWRKLAREHHPDRAFNDPAAAERATRRMAEINRAYAELRTGWDGGGAGEDGRNGRRSGPPPPRPSRPVTGRVDTTATFRPRNQTMGPRARPEGQRPTRGPSDRLQREPLRASMPNGPLDRRRQHNFRPPPPPSLDEARGRVIEFGKFHGHSLGSIADFEPTYIDWLARTISRDPDLVAAARAIQDDLDARGIVRLPRPTPA